MIDTYYPPYFKLLRQPEKEVVETVVSELCALEAAVGLRWGGSSSLMSFRDDWTDIDLWLLVQDGAGPSTKRVLMRRSEDWRELVFSLNLGEFDFFGDLISFFFFPGCLFSIDIGICTSTMLEGLNPGPQSVLVWGDWPTRVSQHGIGLPESSENRRLAVILTNLLKVQKALARGYLWNAIEYTARARRELIGLMISDVPTTNIRYSRPDHSVEAVLSVEELGALSTTCPRYSRSHIAQCASQIGLMSIHWAEETDIKWKPLAELRSITQGIRTGRGRPLLSERKAFSIDREEVKGGTI